MKTLAAFALLSVAAFGQDAPLFIKDATVHPVSSADFTGSVLVQGGVIVDAGEKLRPPKGATVMEAQGMHLYPGMIDSSTILGLSEIESIRETRDFEELGDFNPQLRAIIAVNPESEHIPVTRANGITSAITAPGGGVISGQSALIHLNGWTWEEMEVKAPAAMELHFPVIAPGGRGGGRGGFTEARRRQEERVRQLHEFFEQARRYQKAKQAGGPTFETDLKLEAMLPVLERRLPVVITAERERAVKNALEFANTEQIRVILAGVREVGSAIDEIVEKKIPIILPETLALPLEEDSPYDSVFAFPGELFRKGVLFAFATFSDSFSRNLPYQAAAAVPFGLPQQEALKAVTLNPARIWGVDDKLGSIEKGKWADLVLADGDLLEARTNIKQLWIRGKSIDLDNRQSELYQRYLNRP